MTVRNAKGFALIAPRFVKTEDAVLASMGRSYDELGESGDLLPMNRFDVRQAGLRG